MQTNPAAEQNKNIKWSQSPWNQSGTSVCLPQQCYHQVNESLTVWAHGLHRWDVRC